MMADTDEKKMRRKKILPGPHCSRQTEPIAGVTMSSSSDDDQDFAGFLSSGQCFNNFSSPGKNKNQADFKRCSTAPKQKLECYECNEEYDIVDLEMDQTNYLLIQSMANQGSRWHCSTCLNNKKLSKPKSASNIEKQIEKLSMQISSINDQMKNLTKSHSKLAETTNKITTVAENLSSEEKSRLSWAEIASVENPSVDIITNLTKQVLKDQKILCATERSGKTM